MNGAPSELLSTYEEERRPVAEYMLGLSTKLLDAAKRGDLSRGRDTHQLDIGYPTSSLAWTTRQKKIGVTAGDRAPDAPIRGQAGQAGRLFELFRGPHWTLLGYEVGAASIAPRNNLHIRGV